MNDSARQMIELMRPQIEAGAMEAIQVDPVSQSFVVLMVTSSPVKDLALLQAQWHARLEAIGAEELRSEIVTLPVGEVIRTEGIINFLLADEQNIPAQIRQYIFIHGGQVYILQFQADIIVAEDLAPTFDRIIESVRVVE